MMKSNIAGVGEVLEKIAVKILLLFSAVVLLAFLYYSSRYTEVLWDGTEICRTIRDSVIKNIIASMIVFLFLSVLRHFCIKRYGFNSYKIRKVIIAVSTIGIGVFSVAWVTMCHVRPIADGGVVCTVAELALQGDYGTMSPPGYISYNPHQLGLAMVLQILFRLFGIGNYKAFQYLNALCIPLLFYGGYRLLLLVSEKTEIVYYYIILFMSCLPLFIYVPYVYGEITSITFTIVLMWQVVAYCKNNSKNCLIWGTLAAMLACLTRMNSIIAVIASGIVLILYGWRRANVRAAIWFLGMIAAVFVMNRSVQVYYEQASGKELLKGIPYISYILMGLQEGESGPGWFNHTNYIELQEHDYDSEQTAIDNREDVKQRLLEMWENKKYSVDFFRRKVLTQWNAPAYNSFISTRAFDCDVQELPGVVRWIYYDGENKMIAIMNRYQFILFLCTAVMILAALKRSSDCHIEDTVLLIAIVGGLLFSIIWEAKSRYILPYFVYMIPLASIGMWKVQKFIEILFSRMKITGGMFRSGRSYK